LAETGSYPERGFEWYYWHAMCHRELYTLDGATEASWSPDGKRLATADLSHGTIRVREAGNGKELLARKVHEALCWVFWSPDGKRLATASVDGTAKVLDAVSGRELLPPLRVTTGRVWDVAWSPDGRRLATGYGEGVGGLEKGSDGGTVKVWDAENGRLLLTLLGHEKRVGSVAWSPDGKRLATASVDGTAKVWDLTRDGELRSLAAAVAMVESPMGQGALLGIPALLPAVTREVLTLKTPQDGAESVTWSPYYASGQSVPRAVMSVAWSPDGLRLATAHRDNTARVWDAATGQHLFSLAPSHTNAAWCVAWSPDRLRLATASRDGTAKVWDADSGRLLLHIKGHISGLGHVSWSPDGQYLATGSLDGTVKVWDATSGQPARTTAENTSRVAARAWSPRGTWLATATDDGRVQVRQAVGGQSVRTLSGQEGSITALAWSADERRLATGSDHGSLTVWRVADDQAGHPLSGQRRPINAVAWSPDGLLVATGATDGAATVWVVASGQPLRTFKDHTSGILALAWSPDGKWLATGSGDGTAMVWEVATGRSRPSLKGHANAILAVSWSSSTGLLATGSWDKTARVWDPTDGRQLLVLKGHQTPVRSVAWSPDGQRLATGGGDGTAKVWEVASGQEMLSWQEHTLAVIAVSWSPDGRRLTTASEDGVMKVWEAATPAAVAGWDRQERELQQLWSPFARRDAHAQGFLQDWLLLVPLPLRPQESTRDGLARQQLRNEPELQPHAGLPQTTVDGQELVWQEHRAPDAILDFNGVLGRMKEHSAAYAVCYLHSDRTRSDVRLQVGSDDHAKVYLNGDEVYQYALPSMVSALDKTDPVTLRQGRNVLVFKVVNELMGWQGCIRLVDEDGKPVQGIQVRLAP
jgi:WD40 repeat protein